MEEKITQAEKFMSRALDLASGGAGNVSPNPMVGCVIVHEGKIIGEGYHQQYGKHHAEVNAVNSISNKQLLPECTLFVTLEPCSHFGKTPPCADLIIREKIPEVVIGTVDPFNKVAGSGIKKLRDAGCKVMTGLLEDECQELNRRFFTFHQKRRPYIILKWAQTLDGFLDIDRTVEYFGQPTWITNDISRIAVHRNRSEEDAILVGTNTVLKDNPSLTVRMWAGNNPLRVVLDRSLRLPDDIELFDQRTPTLVYTSREKKSGYNLEFRRISFEEQSLKQVLGDLYTRNIQSLIVEGGAEILHSFIAENLWDEALLFIGPKFFYKGVKAPQLSLSPMYTDNLEGTTLCTYRNI
jgi:diaminohydroxyphosphoribosylaminopyrimidine deaminase/5-amino-6-(5-phosphoribosylamino)uracil reductase